MLGRLAWLITALPVVIVTMAVAFVSARPITVLPRQGLAPSFELVDQHGSALTSLDLRGAVVLYSFVSGCDSTCVPPSPMGSLSNRLGDLNLEEPPIHLVTVAIDPVAPTAPFGSTAQPAPVAGDVPRWKVLSGEPTRMKHLVGTGFGLGDTANAPQDGVAEAPMVLVDGWGIVRAQYSLAAPSVDLLLHDIGLVVDEARQSHGAARYAYEAAHMFACYPR